MIEKSNCEKSILYFLNSLEFCISEMQDYYPTAELVIDMTKEAYSLLQSINSQYLIKNFTTMTDYFFGVEINIKETVDSPMGFTVRAKNV